jgi:hypothetical protein
MIAENKKRANGNPTPHTQHTQSPRKHNPKPVTRNLPKRLLRLLTPRKDRRGRSRPAATTTPAARFLHTALEGDAGAAAWGGGRCRLLVDELAVADAAVIVSSSSDHITTCFSQHTATTSPPRRACGRCPAKCYTFIAPRTVATHLRFTTDKGREVGVFRAGRSDCTWA